MEERQRMERVLTWEEMALEILWHLETARQEAILSQVHNWTQHARCLAALTELEEQIQTANRRRNWISDPEPVIRKFQLELMKSDEKWARNLARYLRLWLRRRGDYWAITVAHQMQQVLQK
jgi:hypothetical protein